CLPASVQPLARKLSDRLFRVIGETFGAEDQEQTESEGIPTAPSAERLEAEFDVAAAQLLLTENEHEGEHIIGGYEEAEQDEQPLAPLDAAPGQQIYGLSRPRPPATPPPRVQHPPPPP